MLKINLKEFLSSLSMCLDFVEIDILGATTNHSRRVAYISLKISELYNFSKEEKFELFSYAVLHDNGLSEETVFTEIDYQGLDRLDRIENLSEHCEIGERNVEELPFIHSKNIVKYHHEFYDGSGFFGLKGDEIPLMAQIIGFADYVDNLFHFEIPTGENKLKILGFINKNKGILFSKTLIEIFLEIAKKPCFWMDLRTPFIYDRLNEMVPDKIIEFKIEDLLKFTKIISRIIDCKSKFTLKHSSGLSEKANIMADFYKFDDKLKSKVMVAANLHDLGKLAIPNSILDKPAKLNKNEIDIIQQHTYYTRAALSKIKGFEEITEWASNHHEKLDGSGYPYGFNSEKLDFISKLLACLDIYQALTEERPYRKPMKHSSAIEILKSMSTENKLDKRIVNDINNVFK